MGIKDGGEPIDIREEAGDITEQRAKYRTGGKGIEIAAVSDKLIANERNDEDFKIMLCLFLLITLLYHKCQLHQFDVSPCPERCAVYRKKELGYMVL